MKKSNILQIIFIFLFTTKKLVTSSRFIPTYAHSKNSCIREKKSSSKPISRGFTKPNILILSDITNYNTHSNLIRFQEPSSHISTETDNSISENKEQLRLPGTEWQEALDILEKTQDASGIDPMVVVHNAAIGAYERRSNGVKALQTFEALIKSHHLPDKISFINTMSACVKSDMNDAVLQLFDDMKETNIHPDLTIYLIVLSALAKLGDASRALSVLESMRKDLLLETIPTQAFLSVIEACSLDSRYEDAIRCFDEIQDRSFGIPLRTYTHLLLLCNESNHWEKALDLFRRIQNNPQFLPNLQVMNLLLDSLGSNYQTKKMEQIWSTFQDVYSHLIPNSQTYNIILRSYSKLGLWDRSLTLLQDLINHNPEKLVPQHFIYTLEACLLGQEFDKAMNVAYMMDHNIKGKGIPEAYTLLFSYLAGRKEYEKILNIYHKTFQNSDQFYCLLATFALEAAFQVEEYSKAKVLYKMIRENCLELSPFMKTKLDSYSPNLLATETTLPSKHA